MKKSAQGFTTTSLHSCGFTLVELLVVISIIAILSAVGVVVFTRVSQTARDGKRVADIDAIAKSLETAKDFTTGIYYNKLSIDFPDSNGGIPTDPTSTQSYCICAGSSSSGTDYSLSALQLLSRYGFVQDGCLTVGCSSGPWVKVSSTSFPSNTRFWSICVVKEAINQVNCKHNLGQ